MTQRTVVLAWVRFQIGYQIPGLIVIQALCGKLPGQLKHIRWSRLLRPHNAGVILDLLLCCFYIQDQKIRLILRNQVLNGKTYRCHSLIADPILYLGSLDQTLHGKCTDLVTDPCNGIAVFMNAHRQTSVCRKNRNRIPGSPVSHILKIPMKSVDLLSLKLCIHHRQTWLVHGRIYGILLLHTLPGACKVHHDGSNKYKKQDSCSLHEFFHMLIHSFFADFIHVNPRVKVKNRLQTNLHMVLFHLTLVSFYFI